MESAKSITQLSMSKVFETYGERCPNCGDMLYRPKMLNHKTGKKMYGACSNCGYKEPVKDDHGNYSGAELTAVAQKAECEGYFKKYSVFLGSGLTKNRFSNFETSTPELSKALRIAETISQDVANKKLVHAFFMGQTGRGKTHLASAIVNDLMIRSKYQAKVIFISVALINEISYNAINDKESAQQLRNITEAVKTADFVVLDDVGTERDTDWGKFFIDEVTRYREEQALMVTTNLSASDFEQRYSERTLSRLRYHANGYSFMFKETKDYRKLN